MSAVHHPVQRESHAVQASLSRLRLLCRFDFRQKIWVHQSSEFHRERESILAGDSAALASAISKNHFSDPSLGGANPSKPASRRIGIPHLLQRSLGKTKKLQRKNETKKLFGSHACSGRSRFFHAFCVGNGRAGQFT